MAMAFKVLLPAALVFLSVSRAEGSTGLLECTFEPFEGIVKGDNIICVSYARPNPFNMTVSNFLMYAVRDIIPLVEKVEIDATGIKAFYNWVQTSYWWVKLEENKGIDFSNIFLVNGGDLKSVETVATFRNSTSGTFRGQLSFNFYLIPC